MPVVTLMHVRAVTWGVFLLVSACGGATARPRGQPGHYAQTVDSATNACLRNPACHAQVGEEAVLPWLSRAAKGAQTAMATLRLLEAAELRRVEGFLVECAKQANLEVNDKVLGEGKRPTREFCEKEARRDASNNIVTWAMELGREKHAVALACVNAKLREQFPGRFSVEPRYLLDPRTGRLRLLGPDEVKRWLEDGLFHLLSGTLVPDVVIHAPGDALRAQTVYDFKFPCATSGEPLWSRYPQGHSHANMDQGSAYMNILKLELRPARVSPNWGISR